MKKANFLITGLFIFLFSVGLFAQTPTGTDYYEGSWNVKVESPMGLMEMVVDIALDGDEVITTINDANGDLLYPVTGTVIEGDQATIKFIGSQGDNVALDLKSKDENTVSGSVMGMYGASGSRVK